MIITENSLIIPGTENGGGANHLICNITSGPIIGGRLVGYTALMQEDEDKARD